MLLPGEDTQAVVEFRPKDTMHYCELVEFEINGLSKKVLTVRGEGVLMKVYRSRRLLLLGLLIRRPLLSPGEASFVQGPLIGHLASLNSA